MTRNIKKSIQYAINHYFYHTQEFLTTWTREEKNYYISAHKDKLKKYLEEIITDEELLGPPTVYTDPDQIIIKKFDDYFICIPLTARACKWLEMMCLYDK